jgi:hypothetical protein
MAHVWVEGTFDFKLLWNCRLDLRDRQAERVGVRIANCAAVNGRVDPFVREEETQLVPGEQGEQLKGLESRLNPNL